MAEALPPSRRLELFVLLLAVSLFGVVEVAVAHNNLTQASTDPAEVRALNSMFQRWRISANQNQWNKSGEPCSGDAIYRDIDWENTEHNPFIKCDCTYESNTLCHVTQLKVYAMNVVGELPHELYTLTYLTHVELYKNHLTGSISPSIGNLTRLQHLHVGINALSGELPRELGMLSDMSFLGIESNNFSGPLPSELSSWRNLREFWMDGSGITGKIPPSFANLSDMRLLVASDTQLTGRIPEFIGNWTHLTTLRFQGNAFEGPIPASFSKLTSLEELRISDLSNGSSSLAFIREMKSLSILELRNNNISDSIPSNIGEYQDLRNLDLSFNNINGHIPDALFNLSRLTLVSLSKNKLNGTLPAAKSSTLLNIDVSQNNLAGSLPSWINEGNLQLNLAGNSFTREGSNSATPNLNATVSNNPPSFTLNSTGGNQTGMIVGFVVGVVAFILLSVLIIFYVLKRRKQLIDEDEELIGLDAKPYMFSYVELRTATEDFNSGNKLGEGGFGPVYKGKLSAGREIAVKQLSVASHQGKSQFVAEIATISEVQHSNLVRLYGCCIARTKKLLVYEYMENKSLDQALFEKSSLKLDWPIRFDICLGVAKGLAYLHEESRLRIIHRDVKASNILLDADLVPKISDFGLAKLYDDKKTHISTRVAGTIGYLAPEYAMRGHLTEKTDVFAFGVVALEVVSGRPNLDTSLEEDKIYLLEWAWNLHENNQEIELVDSRLSNFNKKEVKRLIGVALLCMQTMLSLRPPMSRVVAMLSGDIEVPQVSSRPVYLTGWRLDDPTTSFMSAVAVQGTDANSLTNSSGMTITDHLSKNASKRALHDLIRDDR